MTAFDSTVQLGSAIRVERKSLGMTQEGLAMAPKTASPNTHVPCRQSLTPQR